MKSKLGVSRRGFVKGVAGTAAVPGAMAGLSSTSAATPDGVSVVATVVRVSHSRLAPKALRVGVRASVQGPDYDLDNIVLVVEPVPFGSSASEMNAVITRSVEEQVADLIERRGLALAGSHLAVQVFGGVLG